MLCRSWSGKELLEEAARSTEVTNNPVRANGLFKELFAGTTPPKHGLDGDCDDFESTGGNEGFDNT